MIKVCFEWAAPFLFDKKKKYTVMITLYMFLT